MNKTTVNIAIIIAAFFAIGLLMGQVPAQIYTGISETGQDSLTLENTGNLDTRIRDFSLTSTGTDGNQFYREFTTDHTKIAGTHTRFPMKHTVYLPNGVRSDGGNIRITDSNNTKLPREIESYNPATGELKFHFAGDISDTADNTFRICYGNTDTTEPAADSTHGSQNVWDSNYAGVWHLTQDFKDSTSNANHGTGYGGVTPGPDGTTFDGVDDYVDCGNDVSLNPVDEVTLDACVHSTGQTDGFDTVIDKGYWDGCGGYQMTVLNPSSFGFQMLRDAGVNICYDISSTGLFYGAGVSQNGEQILYIDAVGVATDDVSGQLVVSGVTLKIGNAHNRDYYFKGTIAEVRISNIARSPDYITTENNNRDTSFFKSISSEHAAGIKPGLTIGNSSIYYDGTTSSITFSDGKAYIGTADVTTKIVGELPLILSGTTQTIKVDHGLEYSIEYIPKNMQITSVSSFEPLEDLQIETTLTTVDGNPTSYQPTKMRVRLLDSSNNVVYDTNTDSTSIILPGKYLHDGHYQLRLSYYGYEFGGFSNEISADFDTGTTGFTVSGTTDHAPTTLAESDNKAVGLLGLALTGWMDIPIIGDILRFFANLIGVTI